MPMQPPYQAQPQGVYGYPAPAPSRGPPVGGPGYNGGYSSTPPAGYGTPPPRPAAAVTDALARFPEDQRVGALFSLAVSRG